MQCFGYSKVEMFESELETVDINVESSKFRYELTNELIQQYHSIEEPRAWVYKGKEYHSKFDLFIAVLAYEAAQQLGISDIVGLIAVLSGQAFIPTRAKLDSKRSTKGTSFASKYLSKGLGTSPVRLPMVTGYPKLIGGNGMRIAFTKVVGKFVGRAIPFIGWGILTYDVGMIFYNTSVTFNKIIDGD